MLLKAFQILRSRQVFGEICNTINWFVAGRAVVYTNCCNLRNKIGTSDANFLQLLHHVLSNTFN
jgi:hypothetical protein